jgi:adenylate cyclase
VNRKVGADGKARKQTLAVHNGFISDAAFHGDRLALGQRRLAAIMFTDMVGYTAMAQKNESLAVELLEEHRRLLRPLFRKHGGREIGTIGDAFLVEFASALDAVKCAVGIQSFLEEANARRPEGRRIVLRIGIHLGDVIHKGGDVSGDAVNIASRIEPLALPGGVCLTEQIYHSVVNKVDCEFESMGNLQLKNVTDPVEVYRIADLGEESAAQSLQAAGLPKNRIAVLPFVSMSPDPNDTYFADGMTEELISTISKIGELGVISRASAMRYKGTKWSTEQVGRDLRVGTILEGSVRKAGNRVRIAAQLLSVESDTYIWSQNYDRDITDIFGVQGDIAERVAEGLKVKLLAGEKRSLGKKATASPVAYTLYLKGRFYWNERSEAGVNKSIRYFEEATRADPMFAEAYSGLADAYSILADYGWMAPARAGALAGENASRALGLDDSLAEAHASLGLIMVKHRWDFEAGERELKRAIELKPSYAWAYHWYGVLLHFRKKYGESLHMMERAGEFDPDSRSVKVGLAVSLLNLGRTAEALARFRRIAQENPDFAAVHYWTAITHVSLGDFPEAVREIEKEIELEGGSDDAKLDLAWTKALAGDRKGAEQLFGEVTAKAGGNFSPVSAALVELSLGHEGEGYRWLKRAAEERDPPLLYFQGTQVFSRYWSDPRWTEIRRSAGLPS